LKSGWHHWWTHHRCGYFSNLKTGHSCHKPLRDTCLPERVGSLHISHLATGATRCFHDKECASTKRRKGTKWEGGQRDVIVFVTGQGTTNRHRRTRMDSHRLWQLCGVQRLHRWVVACIRVLRLHIVFLCLLSMHQVCGQYRGYASQVLFIVGEAQVQSQCSRSRLASHARVHCIPGSPVSVRQIPVVIPCPSALDPRIPCLSAADPPLASHVRVRWIPGSTVSV
jgi:hypothetical protein